MDKSPDYLWDNCFFVQFVVNFSPILWWQIYVFGIFNMVDFFSIFVISPSTKILIVLRG